MEYIKFCKIFYTFITIVFLFIISGCDTHLIDNEEFVFTDIEYRYYWESITYDYDCFPEGKDAFIEEFKEADILPEVTEKDHISPPNTYPPTWAQLVSGINDRYSESEPWYLEGGLDVEPEANWGSGDACGYAFPDGPTKSFALIFVGKIRDIVTGNPVVAIDMVTIHEMGHEYGQLSDKYSNSEEHTSETCCVMDQLYMWGGSVQECKTFCDSCIDSLKKINWNY